MALCASATLPTTEFAGKFKAEFRKCKLLSRLDALANHIIKLLLVYRL